MEREVSRGMKCKDRIYYGPICKSCVRETECETIEKQIWENFKETEDYKFELKHSRQFPKDFMDMDK